MKEATAGWKIKNFFLFFFLSFFFVFFPAWAKERSESELALEKWREGHIDDALNRLQRALSANADDPEIWNDYGVMNLSAGNKKEAEKAFARALALRPGHVAAVLNMGNLLLHNGRIAESLAQFNTGLAWNGKNISLLIGRAQLYSQESNYKAALKDLEQAFSLASGNPHVLNELAWLLATCPNREIRNGKRSLDLARKALDEASIPDPVLLDTLAAAYAENGEFEEAVAVQQKALEIAFANGFPMSLLEVWQERYGLYQLHLPYRMSANNK